MTATQLATQAYSNEIHAIFTADKRKKNQLLKAAKAMIDEAMRMTEPDEETKNMSDDELLAALTA
jgi:leucyl aminopeptidase